VAGAFRFALKIGPENEKEVADEDDPMFALLAVADCSRFDNCLRRLVAGLMPRFEVRDLQ
jgi:hypothetical protein